MPAYNFQPQFVVKIFNREKTTTIRRRRKRPTEAGDLLMLYIGLRTKNCMKFAEVRCVGVTPIIIWPWARCLTKTVVGQSLSKEKTKEIAKADGFEDVKEFFKFFERYKGHCLAGFEIIEWDPDTMVRYESYTTEKWRGEL